jgi:hypothetical protein
VKIEFVVAALFLLGGLVSIGRSLSRPVESEDDRRSRFLLAMHDAAKAGFWLSLGGFFLAYGLVPEPQAVRYAALIPLGMAGLRLLASTLLARAGD